MKRFFVDAAEDNVLFTEDNHKHFAQVLRGKEGDEVILCPGDGFDYAAKAVSVKKHESLFKVTGKALNLNEPKIGVTLFMCVMKGDKNEFVVQKATELGVKKIVPVCSQYCTADLSPSKADRLNKMAIEAAKQCGRAVYPHVEAPQNISAVIPLLKNFPLTVFPYEKEETLSIRDFLKGIDFSGVTSAAVIIGSEGGFSEEEAEAFKKASVTPVTLGRRILRAETASVAVLSAFFYEAGEMSYKKGSRK